MSDREPLTPELKAVEAALASLVPTPPTPGDRDRMMFAAGRAAAHRGPTWLRDMTTTAVIAAAMLIGRWSAPYPTTSPQSQIATTRSTPIGGATSIVISSDPNSYLQLRRHLDVLEVAGIEPPPRASNVSQPTPGRNLLHELLN